MFVLALFTGIYSYGIFLLGILGILTKPNIITFTLSWLIIVGFYLITTGSKFKNPLIAFNKKQIFILALLLCQLLVNLMGTLGPELGFDALWYHLTLPKIWLMEHVIRFIPGTIYKYSVMPKLAETLYVFPLAFSGAVGAKLIHYIFGLLTLMVTYKTARKFLPVTYSLLTLLVLAGNLVFSWQSITAYIDLARAFFEILVLNLFLEKKIFSGAITLGLAITTKILASISLPIFVILLLKNKYHIKTICFFLGLVILIPLPWFIFSYINTGNPVYPFFSPLYPLSDLSLNPVDFWMLFTQSPDPVSPLYLITAPLILFFPYKKQGRGVQTIFIYSALALLFWFVTPRTGGGRFILPYLPAMSVMAVILIKYTADRFLKNLLITITLVISVTSVIYRFAANLRYIPVILGTQTVGEFLSANLNFHFGDYYDTDNYLEEHLKPSAVILPVGINNLFYLRYPLIIPGSSPFSTPDYLLVRYTDTGFRPDSDWQIIHINTLTNTYLYANSIPNLTGSNP